MSGASEKTALLKAAFAAGLEAVMPESFMADVVAKIQANQAGRDVHLLAFGKAAGAMAQAFFLHGAEAKTALIIVPEGVSVTLPDNAQPHSEVITSRHPVPNENSEIAARSALAQAAKLGPDDLYVVLISGGGSSLVSLGLDGVSLADKQALNEALLASGLAIQEMNVIRKHVSAIKGGRLAAKAFPAQVMSFALSDVPKGAPGEAESAIASGPTIGDGSTAEMARRILATHQITVPHSVTDLLAKPQCETPFEDDPIFASHHYEIVASSYLALQKAGAYLEQAGYRVVILEEEFQQDAATLAQIMADKIKDLPAGTALISGGEASVMVTGTGVGGRNAQFALEFALLEIDDVCGLACDTDGIDGAHGKEGAVAGAVFDDQILAQARAKGLDARAMAQNNDAHRFFGALGGQIRTGPTQTNVNDLRILLKGRPVR